MHALRVASRQQVLKLTDQCPGYTRMVPVGARCCSLSRENWIDRDRTKSKSGREEIASETQDGRINFVELVSQIKANKIKKNFRLSGSILFHLDPNICRNRSRHLPQPRMPSITCYGGYTTMRV